MSISVKFFASLREQVGHAQLTIDSSNIGTITEVWQQATQQDQPPANTLAALNMEYVELTTRVSDGDEVAFFPPVTGG